MSRLPTMCMPTYTMILQLEKLSLQVLHFLNQTPIDAYTKRQSTVELQPMDLNLLLQGQQLDQIIDIRTTLRYLEFHQRQELHVWGQ